MNKRPEVTRQTRENLQKAFWKLYARKSIEKITVKEVTDLAGYNRGTFYLYYKDIYQLLEEEEEKLLLRMKENVERLEKDKNDGGREFLDTILRYYRKYRKHLNILFGPHGDPAFSDKWKEAMKAEGRIQMRQSGLFDEDILELFLEYHVSGSIAVARSSLAGEYDISVEKLAHMIRRFEEFLEAVQKEYQITAQQNKKIVD